VTALLDAPADVCAGCPRYPHIDDTDLRFPICEVCRWPAVAATRPDGRHAFTCPRCRHVNRHGTARPRVATVCLDAGKRGQPEIPPDGPVSYGYGVLWRGSGTFSKALRHSLDSALGPGPFRRVYEQPAPDPTRRPILVRGVVADWQVLIVGGTCGPLAVPLPRGVARVSCPCRRPAPCVHARSLHSHAAAAIGDAFAAAAEGAVPLAS
jgi:hypothetical protein